MAEKAGLYPGSNPGQFSHPDVGRNIKALYENGWHIGEVMYYSFTLGEFKIDYPDYPSDIDDVGIFLLVEITCVFYTKFKLTSPNLISFFSVASPSCLAIAYFGGISRLGCL